jgi:hypothetical protein
MVQAIGPARAFFLRSEQFLARSFFPTFVSLTLYGKSSAALTHSFTCCISGAES